MLPTAASAPAGPRRLDHRPPLQHRTQLPHRPPGARHGPPRLGPEVPRPEDRQAVRRQVDPEESTLRQAGGSPARDLAAPRDEARRHHRPAGRLRGRPVHSHRHRAVRGRRALRPDRRAGHRREQSWLLRRGPGGQVALPDPQGRPVPARQEHSPPRPEAGEHPLRRQGRRVRQAHRLRTREAARRSPRGTHDDRRRDSVLHRPRGPEEEVRQELRSVVRRCHRLHPPGRLPSLQREEQRGHAPRRLQGEVPVRERGLEAHDLRVEGLREAAPPDRSGEEDDGRRGAGAPVDHTAQPGPDRVRQLEIRGREQRRGGPGSIVRNYEQVVIVLTTH
mmetsp:Transcript_35052/g.78636  ORF Transcript_35052/g.78636 Transcript_35052/m.78636 type:complete len:334 (-) Transcript_35052:112-1113(-)